MKPLSERQARACENARTTRCRCRCGGTLHGAGRIPVEAPRQVYETLPQSDPHLLPKRTGLLFEDQRTEKATAGP